MEKSIKTLANYIIISVMFAMIMVTGCTKDSVINSETHPFLDETTKAANTLTEDEIASIIFMVEEEKLAMDVYTVMYGLYELNIFDKISQSETKHVNAVSDLFVKYGLENPISGNPQGVFENEEIQALYDGLIEMGSVSKLQALNTGLIIENKDILDIQFYLDNIVVSKDLEQVYTHLLNGSYTHLAAFEKELDKQAM